MLNFLNMLYTALRLKFTPFILDLNIAVKKKKSRIISVNSGPSQAVPVCLEGGGRGVCGGRGGMWGEGVCGGRGYVGGGGGMWAE